MSWVVSNPVRRIFTPDSFPHRCTRRGHSELLVNWVYGSHSEYVRESAVAPDVTVSSFSHAAAPVSSRHDRRTPVLTLRNSVRRDLISPPVPR
ncbi:hypothetical protein Kisp01_19410 [Kineosporia sp. NBRC 101677]|nr:hypothetical protein Kisp01_19410 [Kineosporia sp. NBRC 101677]